MRQAARFGLAVRPSAVSRGPSACIRRSLHDTTRNRSEVLGTAAKLPEAEPVPPLRPRQRVTIEDIHTRRDKAGKLVALTAAASDSDMFKAPSLDKPKAKRWDHHLSEESALREPCKLKQAARHLKKPGLISLGGGIPCAEYFPIQKLSMQIPTVAGGFSEAASLSDGQAVSIGKYDVAQKDATYDLSIALNYGQATGSAQLMRWVTEHTELVSNPPYADWKTSLTIGSTGALEQALRMLCDKERGDALLTEEYSFSTALETAWPLGIKTIGVRMDEQGLLPESMDQILSGWDAKARGARKPHVLYTVPSGQNPTGATQGTQRRRDIYAVCQKHDVFIIEDEPYYFLQMPPYTGPDSELPAPYASVDEFLDALVPSLLSMDVDGRVLRMDSFSKIVVPGSRLGWVTGSDQIIERYIRHAEVASQGPSGISQVVMHKLLDEEWGHEGFLRWLMYMQEQYTKRRNIMMDACEQYLPRKVVSWVPPRAGMFHWLRVDSTQHPDAKSKTVLEIEEEIFNLCISKGALVACGSWFVTDRSATPRDLFFRATYAAATPENMTEAIRRLGEAIRESFRL